MEGFTGIFLPISVVVDDRSDCGMGTQRQEDLEGFTGILLPIRKLQYSSISSELFVSASVSATHSCKSPTLKERVDLERHILNDVLLPTVESDCEAILHVLLSSHSLHLLYVSVVAC